MKFEHLNILIVLIIVYCLFYNFLDLQKKIVFSYKMDIQRIPRIRQIFFTRTRRGFGGRGQGWVCVLEVGYGDGFCSPRQYPPPFASLNVSNQPSGWNT